MTDVEQVAVVVPAHNEVRHLPRCLRALATAALCVRVPVLTVVVLDACDDGSERLAGQFGPDVHFVSVDAGNVGAARAAGFEYARGHCAAAAERTWHATTDADSVVGGNWLVQMTAADADMVLGVVQVPVWRHFNVEVARRYLHRYHSKGEEHNHIHGANMGFRADAYWRSAGSGRWRQARTWTWSSALRPRACVFTETPSCRWRRRTARTAARRTASRSTCAT
jgi:glycosyltransferase involved in cell wall biosynthesis